MGGLVIHSNGRHIFRCTIRDLSEKSARVSVPIDVLLPERLYLIHLRDRAVYDADVIWFDGREVALALRRTVPFGQLNQPELVFLRKIRKKSPHRTELRTLRPTPEPTY